MEDFTSEYLKKNPQITSRRFLCSVSKACSQGRSASSQHQRRALAQRTAEVAANPGVSVHCTGCHQLGFVLGVDKSSMPNGAPFWWFGILAALIMMLGLRIRASALAAEIIASTYSWRPCGIQCWKWKSRQAVVSTKNILVLAHLFW